MRQLICLQLSNHIKNADAYRNNNEIKKLGNFFTRAANLYDFRHLITIEQWCDLQKTNCI